MRSVVPRSSKASTQPGVIDRPELELLSGAFQSLEGIRTGLRYAASSLLHFFRLVPALVRQQAALRAFLSLPRTLTLTLSSSEGMRAAHLNFGGRSFLTKRNLAVSVLEIPENPTAYLSGRSRHALRNNRSRAFNDGLSVQAVGTQRAGAAMDFLGRTGMSDETFQHAQRAAAAGEGAFWTVATAAGEDFGIAYATLDGPYAFLNTCVVQRSGDQSAARYLLNSEIFLALAQQGVRYVFSGSALFMGPGLVYFQRRLGFDLCRVEIIDSRGSQPTTASR